MSSKMIQCKSCGKVIAKQAIACPACGAKNKKPFFKKWWFWGIIIIIVVFVFLGNTDPNPKKENEDPTMSLSELSEMVDNLTTTTSEATETDNETTDKEKEPSSEPTTEPTTKTNLIDGMRPEFKAAMDSYEDFFDEYCEFMKKFNANPSDFELLNAYADYMEEYTNCMEKLDEWEGEDMNEAELKYYTEVTLRIEKKLLEVAY